MRLTSLALALSLVLASPAFAQQDQMEQMLAAQAAAEAGASRPGDENLDCAQLEAELGVTMNDPAVQSQISEMGATAQAQMDRANSARNQALGMGAVNMFMGFASSFVPGLGMAQSLAMRGQAANMQAQADANMAQMEVMAQQMQTIMPALMRGQRLMELGQAKQCPVFVEAMQQAPAN